MSERRRAENLLRRVGSLAEEMLWPAAQEVDQAEVIPATHLEALADAGVFGLEVPAELGGSGLGPAATRRVMRRIAGACGATAFVLAQHHGVVAALARSDNAELRSRLLPRLRTTSLAGIAFAHMRRAGPPLLRATPTADGWCLDGEAPWVTSWGMAVAVLLAARSDDGRVVWVIVPGVERPGLEAGQPIALSVHRAGSTVQLHFEGYEVLAGDVVGTVEHGQWAIADRRNAARPNPLCLGVGDRALALLAEHDRSTASALDGRWQALDGRVERAMARADEGEGDVAALARLRAEVVLATQRSSTALLAATGGRGMTMAHPAQRLAREALFYIVQAQSGDGRQAMLSALSGEAREVGEGVEPAGKG